ncbi:TauD/TfdA dioxygenase family protein [Hydrogenophaga sp. BPS33]|uniref:TauD/TfdA dioxygenase family protein n=1 Tax=Hydrogenophaga sp. BPS33 TaxID=2651974 RepID=UPI0013202ADE|nr:TauD/TfdA family dioxygenase [Hydrogenophaga sp. BPS33]QHE84593.1 TauD/TfdA family dioxygenase [Hydrogenophaga sp. BPS33]
MPFQLKQLHKTFFGEITGLDLGQPLDEATVAAVTAAIDRHGVLVFRDQNIGDGDQLRFSNYFGQTQRSITVHREEQARRLGQEELSDISNLDEHGFRMDRTNPRRLYQLTTMLWHTDSSFRNPVGKYTFLCAKRLPAEGGNTEFADMCAAWDALPAERQRTLRDLQVRHSLAYSRGLVEGSPPLDETERRNLPPSVHPLVRVHPGSKRPALYLASHAESVEGLSYEEGRKLIDELMAHATRPEFVHAHVWRAGDLVMWDNRSTMHRAMPFDEDRYVRELRRTTVAESADVLQAA